MEEVPRRGPVGSRVAPPRFSGTFQPLLKTIQAPIKGAFNFSQLHLILSQISSADTAAFSAAARRFLV